MKQDFSQLAPKLLNQALCVINKDHKIVWWNDTFEEFAMETPENIENAHFEKIFGCSYFTNCIDGNPTDHFCSICEIRQSIKDAFDTLEPSPSQTLVREFIRNNTGIWKMMQFSIEPFTYEDSDYVLILLTDIAANTDHSLQDSQ